MNRNFGFRFLLIIGFALTCKSFAGERTRRATQRDVRPTRGVVGATSARSTGMIPRRRGVDSSYVVTSESGMTARIDSKRKSADSSGSAMRSALAAVPANDSS